MVKDMGNTTVYIFFMLVFTGNTSLKDYEPLRENLKKEDSHSADGEQVREYLNKLDTHSSSGFIGMDPQMLSMLLDVIMRALLTIFERS